MTPGLPAAAGSGSIALAGTHFAAATLFLLTGAAGLVLVAPELAAGAYLSPRVAGVTHWFTLGWLTTAIFGALHQLLPVALAAPLRSERVGHASLWVWVPGVTCFATGMATGSRVLHHVGTALVAAGIVLMAANVALTLLHSPARDAGRAAIALATGFLLGTLVLGIVLLHNLHTGFLGGRRLAVLATHLHVALVGWVLIMIVGMSHRLLPMFLVAHGADAGRTRWALAALGLGVPLLGAGLLLGRPALTWAATGFLEAGVVAFLLQARAFYRARLRRQLDPGLRFAAVALAGLAVAAALGPFVLRLGSAHPRLAAVYGVTGLLGALVLYVMSIGYKVVPFLAWMARYRRRMGREAVPAVADLYSARTARGQLLVQTASIAGLAAAVALGSGTGARVAALGFAAATVTYAAQLAGAAVGRPRVKAHG